MTARVRGAKNQKMKRPTKVEARRSECYNGLLFPPERDQINTRILGRKSFFNYFLPAGNLLKICRARREWVSRRPE
jgi:hypothetical protein